MGLVLATTGPNGDKLLLLLSAVGLEPVFGAKVSFQGSEDAKRQDEVMNDTFMSGQVGQVIIAGGDGLKAAGIVTLRERTEGRNYLLLDVSLANARLARGLGALVVVLIDPTIGLGSAFAVNAVKGRADGLTSTPIGHCGA